MIMVAYWNDAGDGGSDAILASAVNLVASA